MDMWLWMTGAFLVGVGAICGTMLICEKIRKRALENYDFRREKAYKQIEKERDEWILTAWHERGVRIAYETRLHVANKVYGNKKVRECGRGT